MRLIVWTQPQKGRFCGSRFVHVDRVLDSIKYKDEKNNKKTRKLLNRGRRDKMSFSSMTKMKFQDYLSKMNAVP